MHNNVVSALQRKISFRKIMHLKTVRIHTVIVYKKLEGIK